MMFEELKGKEAAPIIVCANKKTHQTRPKHCFWEGGQSFTDSCFLQGGVWNLSPAKGEV